MSTPEIVSLDEFRAYRATGDRALRNEIVIAYRGLAVALARRFADRGETLDDLIQVAQVGLMKAVERFDPERGVPFSGFATPTVLGELRRHFRDLSWSVRVPRGMKDLHLRIAPAVAQLRNELGRSPSVADVARHLGIEEAQVLSAMEAGAAFKASSLDSASPDQRAVHEHRLSSPELRYAEVEARATVASLLDRLSERSRRIVELRFYDELSQSEIAEKVGISQMHVSRLLRQALDQLGGALGDVDLDERVR